MRGIQNNCKSSVKAKQLSYFKSGGPTSNSRRGKKLNKLNTSLAYQQLLLDNCSKQFTTFNTHKGLFQYNRLLYGMSFAAGIFQRNTENIPYATVRVDDMLVSGAKDEDHFSKLEDVLISLERAGLRLKKQVWNLK